MFSPPILLSRPLLAAEKVGIRFRESEPAGLDLTALGYVLGGMLVLVLVCWLLSYWHARREARVLNSPRHLFRELCRAHGLSRSERELLQEIAEWHALTDPVQLFIEPQRFQPPEMLSALNCEEETNLLQAQLFGETTASKAL